MKTLNKKQALGAAALMLNLCLNAQSPTSYIGNVRSIAGNDNTSVGHLAIPAVNTGNYNCSFGSYAMGTNASGSYNCAYGQAAMYDSYGSVNTAIGHAAMLHSRGGQYCTALGESALFGHPTSGVGNFNIAVGYQSQYYNAGGHTNVSMGNSSLKDNATGDNNVAIGHEAMVFSASGDNNVAIGGNSMNYNSGGDNVSVGASSMYNNNSGGHNVSIGSGSMYNNNSGNHNVSIGSNSMNDNLDGEENVSVGFLSMHNNTYGLYNVSIGSGSMYHNTVGNGNVSLGMLALNANVDGNQNVAVGPSALSSNVDGYNNVAMGNNALGNTGATSIQNTGVGYFSLINSQGGDNTGLGSWSLVNNIGGYANTGVGANADVSGSGQINSTAVGYQALSNASNRVWVGNLNAEAWTQIPVWNPSDMRFKSAVRSEDVKGLEFIKLLRPVVYNFETKKMAEHIVKNMPDSLRKTYLKENFEKSRAIRQSGFLAQEVEEAAKRSGYDFSGLHKPENGNDADTYGLSYSQFVVPLVKGMQEQQQMIEELQNTVREQQEQIEALKNNTATGIGAVGGSDNVFSMSQNEPNPFGSETVIKYNLPQQVTAASLVIYDLTGKQLKTLPVTSKGSSVTISASELSAGIYLYSIIADGKVMSTKRMVVSEK